MKRSKDGRAALLAMWLLLTWNAVPTPPKIFGTKEACVADARKLVAQAKANEAAMEKSAAEFERTHPESGHATLPYDYDLKWKCSEVAQGPEGEGNHMGYVIDPATGEEHSKDLFVPEPDVVAAYTAREDFLRDETACERAEVRTKLFGTFGRVANLAVDLSGTVATLIVQVPTDAALDPDHRCIPASFEGVEVKQEVIKVSPLD